MGCCTTSCSANHSKYRRWWPTCMRSTRSRKGPEGSSIATAPNACSYTTNSLEHCTNTLLATTLNIWCTKSIAHTHTRECARTHTHTTAVHSYCTNSPLWRSFQRPRSPQALDSQSRSRRHFPDENAKTVTSGQTLAREEVVATAVLAYQVVVTCIA